MLRLKDFFRALVTTSKSAKIFTPKRFAEREILSLHQYKSHHKMPESSQDAPTPFTVCVEGNIACGKTTLLNYFSQFSEVETVHEPVHKWINFKSHNLMDLMYTNPVRWSHLFQTYVQLTMMEHHLKPCNKPTKIMERSLFSARYCFVENLFRTGRMSEPEYNVYCEWFKMIKNIINCKVDLIVYLRSDPEILNNRIVARNRSEERSISIDYLRSLHDLHEEWLFKTSFKDEVPILVMDASGTLSEMKDLYMKHMNQIVNGRSLPPSVDSFSSSRKKLKKDQLICTQEAAAAN